MYVFFIDFKTQFIHGKQRILMTMQGWETLTGTKTEMIAWVVTFLREWCPV